MKIQLTPEKHVYIYQIGKAKKHIIHQVPYITDEKLNQYSIRLTRYQDRINFQYLDITENKINNFISDSTYPHIIKKIISDAYIYKFIYEGKKEYFNSEFEFEGKVSKYNNAVWRTYKKMYLKLKKLQLTDSDIEFIYNNNNT